MDFTLTSDPRSTKFHIYFRIALSTQITPHIHYVPAFRDSLPAPFYGEINSSVIVPRLNGFHTYFRSTFSQIPNLLPHRIVNSDFAPHTFRTRPRSRSSHVHFHIIASANQIIQNGTTSHFHTVVLSIAVGGGGVLLTSHVRVYCGITLENMLLV